MNKITPSQIAQALEPGKGGEALAYSGLEIEIFSVDNLTTEEIGAFLGRIEKDYPEKCIGRYRALAALAYALSSKGFSRFSITALPHVERLCQDLMAYVNMEQTVPNSSHSVAHAWLHYAQESFDSLVRFLKQSHIYAMYDNRFPALRMRAARMLLAMKCSLAQLQFLYTEILNCSEFTELREVALRNWVTASLIYVEGSQLPIAVTVVAPTPEVRAACVRKARIHLSQQSDG
jgi:hypothetical protein